MSFFDEEFEWDTTKAVKNIKKHKVSFQEGRGVFLDDRAIDLPDRDIDGEERSVTIGFGTKGRLLTVCWCARGFMGKTIRIISARKSTKKETETYQSNEV